MLSMIAVSTLMMSLSFLFLTHPLSFGLILLIQTLIISVITGVMNYNFWFAYILFLIMVGGMLILFIYMTSVASNEKFKFSTKITVMMLACMIMIISTLLLDEFFLSEQMTIHELDKQSSFNSNSWSLNKFMNLNMSTNLIMIIVYLLIALIMVVKITNIQHGPLRQKF
uniref:NADH-ubiquinone oxidoreductase chain 6 n=1 Tax=Xixuthrus sp. ANIC_25-067096 TaxID=2546577 RepID=A0A6H0N2A1_9CUCU|nr:NADH dehydrogenase subunit 6 [Xixuthrus sp. ANIC_25-067096]